MSYKHLKRRNEVELTIDIDISEVVSDEWFYFIQKRIHETKRVGEWNWTELSMNPNLTWNIIKENRDLPWNWRCIIQREFITWDIIQKNPYMPWEDMRDFSYNPTTKMVELKAKIEDGWL